MVKVMIKKYVKIADELHKVYFYFELIPGILSSIAVIYLWNSYTIATLDVKLGA